MCPEGEVPERNSENQAPQEGQKGGVSVERLLSGLWEQRDELGLIADELLDIFQRHGLTPPKPQK